MNKFQISVLLVFFVSGSLFADTIVLMNGQVLTGKIENQTATDIFIRTPQGLRRVPKAQIGRITYDEALRKQQELLKQQKLLEEQQKQEQLKQIEEQKKQADEVQKQKHDKNQAPPYRRHDIQVWAGLGVQHLTSAIVGLQQKIEMFTGLTRSDFEIRENRSADVGTLFNLGVGYNWNRLAIQLNTEMGRSKVSGGVIERKDVNQIRDFLNPAIMDQKIAELYDPLYYRTGDLTFGYLIFHSNIIDLKPFIGGRKQEYSVKTDIRGLGSYLLLSMPGYRQTQVDSQLSSAGTIGGIEILQPRQANKLRTSLTIGYYAGKASMLTHRNSIIYNDIGELNGTMVAYKSIISVKGPFSNLRLTLPVNDRFDISAGLGYQQYQYSITDLKIDSSLPEIDLDAQSKFMVMKDLITKQTAVKEIVKSIDFRTLYRFDL